MPLDSVNNGDSGATARATINTAIAQIDTNTTDIAGKQPLDADLTAIAGLSPVNDDTMQYISGGWKSRTVAQAKTTLALNNVDNTTDLNKPISTATQTALDLKQDEGGADTTIWRVATFGLDADQNPVVGDNKKAYVFVATVARAFNLPTNASQAFPIGTTFWVANLDTALAAVTVTPSGGVTLYTVNGLSAAMAAQTGAHIMKVDTNTWVMSY